MTADEFYADMIPRNDPGVAYQFCKYNFTAFAELYYKYRKDLEVCENCIFANKCNKDLYICTNENHTLASKDVEAKMNCNFFKVTNEE
jgi:hypothetical protein